MGSSQNSIRSELRLAKRLWAWADAAQFNELRKLIRTLGVSVALGDIRYLDGAWYITSVGLLRLAHRSGCSGITTRLEKQLCDASARRWVFRAVAYRTPRSKGFVGYGDADPSNVSPLVQGAELRIAETRAVNRALRKAYGIGLCSVEELGRPTPRSGPPSGNGTHGAQINGNGLNGHSRLRDRLCLLIRQHQLDPALVKRYAASFCGTEELRNATRESVESFISHLADWAQKDRAGLICKLNSYAPVQEAQR